MMPVTSSLINPPTAYPQVPKRECIFCAYAHKDHEILKEFKCMLRPALRRHRLELWDDSRISAGQKWRDEIQSSLARATVGLLFVSAYFLDSPFISEIEQPFLLEAAESARTKLLWVPVSSCMVERTPIIDFQSVGNPSRPLLSLRGEARNIEIKRICDKIMGVIGA
jgi:hypothetical protein